MLFTITLISIITDIYITKDEIFATKKKIIIKISLRYSMNQVSFKKVSHLFFQFRALYCIQRSDKHFPNLPDIIERKGPDVRRDCPLNLIRFNRGQCVRMTSMTSSCRPEIRFLICFYCFRAVCNWAVCSCPRKVFSTNLCE